MKPVTVFERYAIHELCISADVDIDDRAVTRVDVCFGRGPGNEVRAYRVAFKLLDQASDTHRYLRRIGPAPECRLELTAAGERLGEPERTTCIAQLLDAIAGRIAKVHQEQSILNIQPLGKSFLLMGKTRFEVLADDGAGQLSIRLHYPAGSSEAGLSANGLLDGLYSGLITRL